MNALAERNAPRPAWLTWLVHAGLTALTYYAAGRLALLLAIPPGYATAVWPAAGLALAATILFGYRIWPGIVIGSFFVNVFTSFDASTTAALLKSLTLAVSIGFGAALQAIVGAFLVRRFIGWPNSLTKEKDILTLVLFVGPLSCLVSSTVSVMSLSAAGIISPANFLYSWATWWVGDAIGVLIVTPLVLTWALPRAQISPHRRMTVSAPLCLILALVVGLYFIASTWENNRIRLEFERKTDQLTLAFRKITENYPEVLYSLRAFHNASVNVERHKFLSFVEAQFVLYPGLQALSWDPRVPATERDAFEKAVRQEGFDLGFQITERDPENNLVRAGTRDEYVPILYIEPFKKNKSALGFDVASDPLRREALNLACDLDKPAATGKILLVQEKIEQYGLLVVLPVYRLDEPRENVQMRRQALQGYMVAVFRINDMVEASLSGMDREGIEIELYDDSAAKSDRFLYGTRDRLSRAKRYPFEDTSTFEMAGRHWRLQFLLRPEYLVTHRPLQAWSVLVGGLLFSGMIGALLLILTGHAAVVEEVVVRRTSELKKANEDLKDVLSQLHSTLESTTDGILVMSVERKITNFNQKFATMWRIPDAILETKDDDKALAFVLDQLKDSKGFLDKVMGLYAKPEAESFDVLEFKDGRIFERHSIPQKIETVTVGRVWSFRDVTQSKKDEESLRLASEQSSKHSKELKAQREAAINLAQDAAEAKHQISLVAEALRENEERLAAIVQTARDAIISINSAGKVIAWNKGSEMMFGYSTGEMMGKELITIMPERFHSPHRQGLARFNTTGEARVIGKVVELVGLRKNGVEFPIELSISNWKVEAGTFFTGIVRDITERKKAEMKFRDLLESAPDAMIIVNKEGKIVLVNNQAEKVFGYTHQEFIGQVVEFLIPKRFQEQHPSHRNNFFKSPLARPMGMGLNLWGVRKNGTEFPIEISLSPLETQEETLVTAAIRDITERKKAEEKIQEAAQIKSEFTSMVSHELRTPLTVIKESIGIIQDGSAGAVTPEQEKFLATAKRNIDRLARLINDVLDFQKLDSKQAVLYMTTNDINQVVNEIKESFALPAKSKGLELLVELEETLPPIFCDNDQITQVLTNFMSNALKVMEKGKITLKTKRFENAIRVSVEDEGPGVKKEDFPKLFQVFSQLSTGSERKPGTTGLGLAISKQIIEAHNGKIGVDSVYGKGATFYFLLPIQERRKS